MVAAALVCVLAATALSARTPQVLRLRDAATKQQIAIVGTVHYNPASVNRAKDEVSLALDRNGQKVGAVVVEACESRWTRSLEVAPPGSLVARLTCSEMQGAAGVAIEKGIPVLLGDTDVGPFVDRVGAFAKQSAWDLVNPFGGWRAISDDFARTLPPTLNASDVANSELLLAGEAPLSIGDYARPDILLGFLYTPIRYVAAFAIKAPFAALIFAAALAAIDSTAAQIDTMASSSMATGELLSLPVAAELVFSTFEIGLLVLTTRLLLVPFLEERNAELARSIRRAAAESEAPVVAILGGLHVNGVARLLLSEETPDADGRKADGVWWDPPAGLDTSQWI